MTGSITTIDKKKAKQHDFVFGPTWYPGEALVKFSARYLQRRVGINSWQKKRDVKRILDAGCGLGRHLVFFAEQGFETYGIDLSREAINTARKWLQSKRLHCKLRVGDLSSLPYKDEYFDVVISYGVLDHMSSNNFYKALKEIKRVTNKGGYIYLTLRSTSDSEYGRGKKLGNNVFILQNGYAKGTVQHFFNQDEIRKALKGLRIFEIEIHEEIFPDIFTIDKSFLQSSTGKKQYIDINKKLDFKLKYSRWYITAEKT